MVRLGTTYTQLVEVRLTEPSATIKLRFTVRPDARTAVFRLIEAPVYFKALTVRVQLRVLNTVDRWDYSYIADLRLERNHNTEIGTDGGLFARVKNLYNLARSGFGGCARLHIQLGVPTASGVLDLGYLEDLTAGRPPPQPPRDVCDAETETPRRSALEDLVAQVESATLGELAEIRQGVREINTQLERREARLKEAAAEHENPCPVCLEGPRDHALGCGHVFCGGCIAEFTNKLCPNCRAPITGPPVRLYL